VVTHATDSFRTLANAQVQRGDRVVEIGASTGETAWRLARAVAAGEGGSGGSKSGSYVGVDCSEEMVATAKKAHPDLEFQLLDCLMEKYRFLALCEGADCIFIDIGGSRSAETVVLVLALLLKRMQPKLVVIKCEELVADLDANTTVDDSGEVQDAAAWFTAAVDAAAKSSESWGRKKDQRKIRHPLRHQRKLAPNGVEICRYYQFGECHRASDPGGCPYEHGLCYECLEPGHRALDCTAFAVRSGTGGTLGAGAEAPADASQIPAVPLSAASPPPAPSACPGELLSAEA